MIPHSKYYTRSRHANNLRSTPSAVPTSLERSSKRVAKSKRATSEERPLPSDCTPSKHLKIDAKPSSDNETKAEKSSDNVDDEEEKLWRNYKDWDWDMILRHLT
jgi:hypothetical protein